MRYCLNEISKCKILEGRGYLRLDTTDNPLIAKIQAISEGIKGNTYLYAESLNLFSPITTLNTYYGITNTKNEDGSWDINGTCTSSNYMTQFGTIYNANTNLWYLKKKTKITAYVTLKEGSSIPIFEVNNTTPNDSNNISKTVIENHPVILEYPIEDFSSNYTIYFKAEKNKFYDFNVKFMVTFPDIDPGEYVEPMTPITLKNYRDSYTNYTSYNILLKPNSNFIIYFCSSSLSTAKIKVLYDPDYNFNYKTFNEDMDRFEIPKMLRPFVGVTYASTNSGTAQKIILPDKNFYNYFKIRSIKFSYPTSSSEQIPITPNKQSSVNFPFDFNYNEETLMLPSGYTGYNYPVISDMDLVNNTVTIGRTDSSSASYTYAYELILGDPPFEFIEE